MKTSDWHNLYPHFEPEEFLSPEGLVLFKKNIIPCDTSILDALEALRNSLNVSRGGGRIHCDSEIYIKINTKNDDLRGFVTPEEWMFRRSKRKDQTYSYHLWCAADISSNVSPAVLFHYAKINGIAFGGIIKYDWGVHLDMRKGERYVDKR